MDYDSSRIGAKSFADNFPLIKPTQSKSYETMEQIAHKSITDTAAAFGSYSLRRASTFNATREDSDVVGIISFFKETLSALIKGLRSHGLCSQEKEQEIKVEKKSFEKTFKALWLSTNEGLVLGVEAASSLNKLTIPIGAIVGISVGLFRGLFKGKNEEEDLDLALSPRTVVIDQSQQTPENLKKKYLAATLIPSTVGLVIGGAVGSLLGPAGAIIGATGGIVISSIIAHVAASRLYLRDKEFEEIDVVRFQKVSSNEFSENLSKDNLEDLKPVENKLDLSGELFEFNPDDEK